jgi:hypothetical protein
MASYETERVEHWENSALDDRIYDVSAPVQASSIGSEGAEDEARQDENGQDPQA